MSQNPEKKGLCEAGEGGELDALRIEDRDVLVYGSGLAAESLLRALVEDGRHVLAVVDDHPRARPQVCGHDVIRTRPEIWADCGESPVLLGVFNRGVSPLALSARLRKQGAARIISYPAAVHALPMLKGTYCLQSATHGALPPVEALHATRSLLRDARSMALWDANIEMRRSGHYSRALDPDASTQYMDLSVAGWEMPKNYCAVDGGAYDGGSIDEWIAGGLTPGRVLAFEPDPENFEKLSSRLRAFRRAHAVEGFAWPSGLGSANGMQRFSGGAGEASRIDDGGDTTISVVVGDDVVAGARVDLIKLDVEGAEPDALLGLRRTIREWQPLLAISAYHTMAHIWELPSLINSIEPGYRFDLRSHGHHGMDLVLYGVPSSMANHKNLPDGGSS